MKQNLLCIFIIPIMFFACDKENRDETLLLAKVSSRGSNNYINIFSYDSQNRLISKESINVISGAPISKQELTYKEGKLYQMDFYDLSYLEFQYFQDSIYAYKCYETLTEKYLTYIFYYNQNVIDSIYYQGSRYGLNLDNNNNFLGTSEYLPWMNYRINFAYDEMNNAYSSLPLEYRIIFSLDIGLNNTVSYEDFYNANTMTYTYNDKNYPIDCIVTHENLYNNQVSYDTLIFEYQ